MKKYLPILAIGGVGYLALSTLWLAGIQGVGFMPSVLIAVVSLVVFTAIVAAINAKLAADAKNNLSATHQTAEKSHDGDHNADQKTLRRTRRIETLQRNEAATHDRVLQLGAIVAVGLALFALVMRFFLGLSFQEVYFIPWWGLALLWFIQIAIFPRTLTYISFFTMAGLRVGIQIFGVGILAVLPNFIMLPFFYLLMMVFMFGSIMLPTLWQTKYNRPGEGDWEVPEGAMRGQPQARAVFETHMQRIEDYRSGRTNVRPARGILSSGPPGTGKTLLVREFGSQSRYPVVLSEGPAFNPPFMGFAPILVAIHKARSEALAREYGWLFLVVDECETLFGMRSGMQPGMMPGGGMGFWDVTVPESDCQLEGIPWQLRPENRRQAPIEHDLIMPMGGGMGGAGIYPFLTWMSGAESPPFFARLWRGTVNTLLDALFVPVTVSGRILRLPPAKIPSSNITFIGLTNRPWMMDPAMTRPGRLELEANFTVPDDLGRFDTLQWYITLLHKEGKVRDEVLDSDNIWAVARSTMGKSQSELEKIVRESVSVRIQHLADLRRVLKIADASGFDKKLLATLSENEQRQREMDRKFWQRHAHEVRDAEGNDIPEGWDERVNLNALMESLSRVSWGAIKAEAIHEGTQRGVAYHEVGHFIQLVALMVKGFDMVPAVLTALPRGEGALGKVVYLPKDAREQYPQPFYEGLLRVALGAYVAEIVMFGQNTPGVSGDLRHATGLSALMKGRFGMRVISSADEERKRYIAIGDNLISLPESNAFLNPEAATLVQQAIAGKDRQLVALRLGMAAVDGYRLLMANLDPYAELVAELITSDEISGTRLREVVEDWLDRLVTLDQLSEEQRSAFPKDDFALANPFYGSAKSEGSDVVAKIDSLVAARKGGRS